METQQMMELMLASMNASMKEPMQQMKADGKADKENMLAERNASVKSNQVLLARLEARIETNREEDREDLKEMREEIKSGQAEMRSTVCAMQSKLKETIHHRMKAVLQPIRTELDETTACNGATETKPDPGMMQSIEEHQEIPKEDAAVLPVGGPRRRHRVCNLATEHRQKRKERTRGNRGYRRKSAVNCRNMSRRIKMAWRKRKLVRIIQTKINYGPRKRLTSPAGRRPAVQQWHGTVKMSGRTAPGTRENEKPRNEENTAEDWKFLECNIGIRDEA
jgi:hypothetical protein